MKNKPLLSGILKYCFTLFIVECIYTPLMAQHSTKTPSLKSDITYNFIRGIQNTFSISYIPHANIFSTESCSEADIKIAEFHKIDLHNTRGRHSSLTIGPDGKLYALSVDGMI